MLRLAIPIFHHRVSPVLDLCTRMLIIDFDAGREIERRELYLDQFMLPERLAMIMKSGIDVIICGGISDVLDKMLRTTNIRLYCGIAGDVDRVAEAYACGRIGDPAFRMPGYVENSINSNKRKGSS